MAQTTVLVAGATGFIGRAIVRRLAGSETYRVRAMSRRPDAAHARLNLANVEWVRGEVTDPATLNDAVSGASAIVNCVQFEGYPVEDRRRGLTFERVDLGGTLALLAAAKHVGAARLIYISGAAADEQSAHPAFRAKGRAERAIRESGLEYTIFRPSLVYGPEDAIVNNLARALKFAPIFPVPGTGRQKLQPVLVDDVAACVALALDGRGSNGTYELGGPDVMTFDELVRLVMELIGRRRPIVHIPEAMMRAVGAIAERLPRPRFSRDAVTFVTADNVCDIGPLVRDFGIRLTPAREGLAYLAQRG
jgi:uncharacterized protein YbjT (DUF2867 family)